MFNIIESKCNESGQKYIYAYNLEPDSSMHEFGCDSSEVKRIIVNLNDKIEELSKKIKDTIIFVVADHGHINVKNIDLNNYPDIVECFSKRTSLEPRTINFFIKEEKKKEFERLFNKYFGSDFDLYTISDVIESKLFGTGEENGIFRDSLGDYLAIAKTDKTLIYRGFEKLKSQHAGYTDDEIYVPLIMIDCE